MKELEDMCGQSSTRSQLGLASEMKPMIEKTRGVLEDAIEFERKKRERAARKRKAQEEKENPNKWGQSPFICQASDVAMNVKGDPDTNKG